MSGMAISLEVTSIAGLLFSKTPRWLVSILFAVPFIFGTSARAWPPVIGPGPELEDPVGASASYITLRSDDLMVGQWTNGGINQLSSYQVDDQSKLSTQIAAALGAGAPGGGNSFCGSGRILSRDNDQLVNVGRSADGAAVAVAFPLGGAFRLSADLLGRFNDVPDQVSVAVGDLDKVPDENGINHDEVVVAYASSSGANSFYNVKLAVLNYSIVGSNSSQPQSRPAYKLRSGHWR